MKASARLSVAIFCVNTLPAGGEGVSGWVGGWVVGKGEGEGHSSVGGRRPGGWRGEGQRAITVQSLRGGFEEGGPQRRCTRDRESARQTLQGWGHDSVHVC